MEGAIAWRADHGSPGVGGSYTEPGTYEAFHSVPGAETIVGFIRAEEHCD